MDMGIKGRTALVCGASQGLGFACAQALAREGVNLVILARRPEPLEQAAAALRSNYNADVRTVACDITTTDGQDAALSTCSEPDIIITNAGGPPPGNFRDFGHDDWLKALNANMLAPLALIRATLDGMSERGFGRIVNITSTAVKAPVAALALSNGARSGLTGVVAGLARQVAQHNVTINNLLPGQFDTSRVTKLIEAQAASHNIPFDEMKKRQLAAIPAGRLGNPDELGAACAFLCSANAGYITGQNWLLDGGAYPGTF